jgi:diaminopimelate decarboxylase
MSGLSRIAGELALDGMKLSEVARKFGTPCYVYSRSMIESAYREFDRGLAGVDHLVCYAVKANSNLAILDLLARLGAGFDIVSGGELARVRAAGGRADRVIFSGVGKSQSEIEAALAADIHCFNVESEPELERLDAAAGKAGKRATVSLRINPDVDARTHPYISTGLASNKFGIPFGRARDAYRRAASLSNLRIAGIGCHIGSQILDTGPLDEALDRVLELARELAADGIKLEHLDLGGGFGIRYRDEEPPDIGAYCRRLAERLKPTGYRVMLEPGPLHRGRRRRAPHARRIPEARQGEALRRGGRSMSELIRPALYESWHEIVPVAGRGARAETYDIVGPVCESSDVLGTDRSLAVEAGDFLAILAPAPTE